MVASSSYSYSDVINGQSNNAASSGDTWDMRNVLPPQAGLTVNGIYHKYTIEKNISDPAIVTIQNDDAIQGGYVFKNVDDWTGIPGNTKVGFDPIASIPATRFGDGSISVDGLGTITDSTILYTYTYDTCYNPIADSSCPGYEASLYQYLLDSGLLDGTVDLTDPYYNEYVQNALDQETETEEAEFEETPEEEEQEEERSMEDMLSIAGAAEDLVDAAQQAVMLAQLSNVSMMNLYYDVTINGGVYKESLKFEDKEIQDNRKALRNLTQQKAHRDMVRSQYD